MTQKPSFEQLRTEQDELRAQAGYLERAQARRAFAPPRARIKPRRLARWSMAAAVLGAAAVLALVVMHPWSPELAFSFGGERGYAGAFVAAPAEHELPLLFADGTRFALGAGSSARVVSMDTHGAHLVIEKGRAVAAVVHRPDSRWRVDVGPFQVAVVGTRFDVSWDVGSRVLELRLVEGAVRVSGGLLTEALEVRAGQRLRAFADDARVELSGPDGVARPEPTAASSGRLPEAASDATSPAAPTLAPSSATAAPLWRSLAAAGKFREALAAAERAGFEGECRRASGADLLALADAARLSGSAARAEQAYAAARGKLPGGGRASYGLGLVAFDQRGDFLRAARYFESYLREQPGGSLRAEATGRLMEAWQRAGHVSEARHVAEQYLSRYPQGPQSARAKQLLQ
ncbi:MAG TPA: FecR domain-containing protein [Polyangiaceae bacterium]|nr:FecR domain-containing protein [Polyangiaceae bacterium]